MTHVAATFDQAGYRWRNDDGNESTATYAAALNTAITLETATVTRCRIVLDETAGGAENNVSTQWQYQLNGGGWVNVTTTSSVVQAAISTQGTLNAVATTQQISSGSFVSAEVTEDGLSDDVRPSFAGNEVTELELVFQLIDADVADTDTVELRVVRADLTLFSTYSQTPSLTVDKGAAAVTIQASPASVAVAAQTVSPVLAALVVSGSPASISVGAQTVNPQVAGGTGQITVVGTPQAGAASNGGDVTLTFDGTPQEGDCVLLVGGNADQDGSGAVGPSTAGYTERHLHQANDGSNLAGGIWSKFLGATPDTDVIGQGSGVAQEATSYACIVLRGVDASVLDAAVIEVGPGAQGESNPDPGAITTVTDNAWVIACGVMGTSDAASAAPSGYSNLASAGAVDTVRHGTALATKEVPTAGSEDPGPFTWANNASGFYWVFTAAIQPATGASGVTVQAAPATLNASAQTTTPVQAALAVQTSPALAAATAQTVTPTVVPVAIQTTPATLTTAAQAITPTQAALVTQASPADLTAAAQTVNPTVSGAPVTITADTATTTTAAQMVTPTQTALTVTADPVTLTTTGQPVSPQQAALSISAVSAMTTTVASVVSPQVASQGVVVETGPATVAASAQTATPTTAALVVQADPATATATGQATQPTVAGEPVVIQAAPASTTTNAQAVNVARAALAIQSDPAAVSPAAQTLVPAFDALVLQAVAATLNVSASTASVVGGAIPVIPAVGKFSNPTAVGVFIEKVEGKGKV